MESRAASSNLLSSALPLRHIGASGEAEPARHFGANLRVGRLVLTAAITSTTRLVLNRHAGFTAVLGYGGRVRVRQAQGSCDCGPDSLLVLCGEPSVWEGPAWSVVAFQVEAESLRSVTASMSSSQDWLLKWKRLRQANHHFGPQADDGSTRLQRALRQQIAIAADLSSEGETLLERLQVDEQILRLLAVLLLPELRRSGALERAMGKEQMSTDPFGDLLAYIQDNLANPLNLTDLEAHSHYSRRTLQYTFRERMGCTASQWIRSQRLDRARRCLENPSSHDSVTSIARDCGYNSMNLFSIDFQQRFHIKPSQLLREARASQPG